MSVVKNYTYNALYQILVLIIPIITVPYISRVLMPDGVGLYSYTFNITQYFILFGTLGIALYGNVTVAYVRDNKEKVSKTFWSIISLQSILTLTSFFIYFIFYSVYNVENRTIYLIQSINILAATVDISWFFMGLEQFKKTVTRNTIVKLIGLASIFIFVKEHSDLWKYALITSSTLLIGQLSMWIYLRKYVHRVKIRFPDVKKHLHPSLMLFIPQITSQVYVTLNKIILGSWSGKVELGYFDNAEKIVKITLTFITALGTVLMPRVANNFAQKEYGKINEYINKSFRFVNYLSVALMFGISAVSINFAPWFFGPAFAKSGYIMELMSFFILPIAWGTVIGIQYLIPAKRSRDFTISFAVGAVVNILLNVLLIPQYKAVGAAIASVAAEFAVAIVQILYVKKNMEIKKLFSEFHLFIIAGIAMYAAVKAMNIYLTMNIFTLALQVATGAVVYTGILYLIKSETNQTLVRQLINIPKLFLKR